MFVDANVLFSKTCRDWLYFLRQENEGMFQLCSTNDVMVEVLYNLVTRVRMVATSATRDAINREDFFAMTRELLGNIQPGAEAEVISGEEEAALSFAGAMADLGSGTRAVLCD